jgi:hypothetical protein
VASLLAFAAAAALFLAGLFFLVWRCGLAGLGFLLGVAGAFLWWFYRGNRSDVPPPGLPGRKK